MIPPDDSMACTDDVHGEIEGEDLPDLLRHQFAERGQDIGVILDAFFHGSETPEYCKSFKGAYKVIKAFRLKSKDDLKSINDYDTDYYLLDTYKSGSIGGTGETFDWKILKDFEILKPVMLSGGLKPDNVMLAIKEVAPYAVDVSTGVEKSPGKKDVELMKKFIENVRRAE